MISAWTYSFVWRMDGSQQYRQRDHLCTKHGSKRNQARYRHFITVISTAIMQKPVKKPMRKTFWIVATTMIWSTKRSSSHMCRSYLRKRSGHLMPASNAHFLMTAILHSSFLKQSFGATSFPGRFLDTALLTRSLRKKYVNIYGVTAQGFW